jgi:hypothetical protein
MDLKSLMTRTRINKLTDKSIEDKEVWPGPIDSEQTPKITGERWRRYFEQSGFISCAAVSTTTLLEGFMDYPSIVREVSIIIDQIDGDIHADKIKIEIDGSTILDMELTQLAYPIKGGQVSTPQINITNNLAATATIAGSDENLINFANATPSLFSCNAINIYGGLLGHVDGQCVQIRLDSYVVRHIRVSYTNVQALEAADALITIVTDRPVETKYSSAMAGASAGGSMTIHA